MTEERLQKILSKAGIASRRAAETMIAEGRVSVNRAVVSTPGTKADPDRDEIRVDGRLVLLDTEKIYLMLHKPQGYVTTMNDPEGRPIVTDLLTGISQRVYPVGRLDFNSEGLLILTNDGEFANKLQHPRYGIPKTYRVKVEGSLQKGEIRAIEKGIDLPDGRFAPLNFRLEKTNPKSSWFCLTICDGRNRIVRRAFESIGHCVTRLIRTAVADLSLDSVREGAWRMLTPREVEKLLLMAAGSRPPNKNCLDIHLKINNSRRN
jgi:23S rRNA pseudouridine2605 synthase